MRLFMLFICSAVCCFATPLIDENAPDVRLTTGRVLHDVQAKSFAPTAVGVRHREGIETIPYDQFPEEFRAVLAAKRPRARTEQELADAKAAVEARAAKPKTPTAHEKEDAAVHEKLRIISTEQAAYAGGWTVEVSNEGDNPKNVWSEDFIGEDSAGASYTADELWTRSTSGRRVEIPGRTTLKIGVIFKLRRDVAPVALVRWKS